MEPPPRVVEEGAPCRTIYKIAADGTFTVLYSFQEPEWGPDSSLIQAT